MNQPTSVDPWPDQIAQTLRAYDEVLLRRVAGKLCKPRGQWPVDVLVDRCLETYANPAALDRRLKDLEPAGRQILALIGHSRQPRWPVGSLVEMSAALGNGDALAPLQSLFESGLLFPVHKGKGRIRGIGQWLAQTTAPEVQAPPALTNRVLSEALPLQCPDADELTGAVHEADGLEWPLRLAALWQQLTTAPLRRTQQRDFFKRDLDRLRGDGLLSAAPSDALTVVPDPGLFAAALALATGMIEDRKGDLCAGEISIAWNEKLPQVVAELLAALPHLHGWNPVHGWQPEAGPGNPYPAAHLLALLLLAQLPKDRWLKPAAIETWMVAHHPYWQATAARDNNVSPKRKPADHGAAATTGVEIFLLGVAYPLRLVQACKSPDGAWAVRLSQLGRWALGFVDRPPDLPAFAQTLVVQPNLEILAYRQGLTPELIMKLTRFATWRTLGAACTLQLEPHSVYRALEMGESHTSIVQTLERHSMKLTPVPVLEALKTWSNKRERISVYPSAVLLEFATPEELTEALSRGVPAVRLTERLAAVASESQIDYKHFRLTGTRDYCLPPEPCATVESDGVTLTVDLARSDLLLETELQRFAEPATGPSLPGRRSYRLTPASLATAKTQGFSLTALASWFEQRTGLPLSPAARLLFTGPETPPAELRRQLVLHVATSAMADGLMQWPATASLISTRLGPTALSVTNDAAPRLRERLHEIGVQIVHEE